MNPAEGHGPRYEINIEGTVYAWSADSITVPQLRALANIPADQQMLEINLATNVEHTLSEDAVIKLMPGQGFAKKVKYQRG